MNSTPRSTWLSLVSTRETGAAKKRHRFSWGHRRDCARHHPAQVAVGGAAKVNASRSQHFESRKRRIYEVLFAELLKLGAPSGPDVMKHWLKAEATSAEVGLSAFWRTPHFFSGNQTREDSSVRGSPTKSSYLISGRLLSPFSGSRKPKRLAR